MKKFITPIAIAALLIVSTGWAIQETVLVPNAWEAGQANK